EQCIARIRNRASRGGHFVPDADVRRRYTRSMANGAEAIRLADIADVYDNSEDGHRLVLAAKAAVVVWRAARLPQCTDWQTPTPAAQVFPPALTSPVSRRISAPWAAPATSSGTSIR